VTKVASARASAEPYAFFQGRFVPISEAKISVRTHAFNYGTGVFEGIRGYWNAAEEQLYLFRMREHYERLRLSCRMLRIELRYSVDELCDITTELVARNGYREDVYVRPLAYKSQEVIGVRLHDLEDDLCIYTAPFGPYLEIEKGIRVCVSSWRRIADTMIPPQAKVTGLYVNSALAKTEANEAGFDEAIMLTQEGTVSEGSAENIFLVKDGVLITPAPSEHILIGITRATIIEIAREELGIPTIERHIGRAELYLADECFLCGTGAQISPVVEIDRRPVGNGEIGPVTRRLQELYFDIVRGRNPKYAHWCRAVYPARAGAVS
jgi:branched-chain amino acid aminotransferase